MKEKVKEKKLCESNVVSLAWDEMPLVFVETVRPNIDPFETFQ